MMVLRFAIFVTNGGILIQRQSHLRSRSTAYYAKPKAAGVAAPLCKDIKQKVKNVGLEAPDSYLPFIREGYVSLVGSDNKVPVKILPDTGAFDSSICVPVRGMGLNVLFVP